MLNTPVGETEPVLRAIAVAGTDPGTKHLSTDAQSATPAPTDATVGTYVTQ